MQNRVAKANELIEFLQMENKNLKEELKETVELLHLNKEALNISIKSKKQEREESLPHLINLLFMENSKLSTRNELLRKQLENTMCQTLISEQIASASTEHQKYVASELKDRLKMLKKEVDIKQKKIMDLMKSHQGKDQKGECQIIEFTDLNKVVWKLQNEIDSLHQLLQLRNQEILKGKDQKEELIKLNLILTKQVNQLKQFSCQTTKSQIPSLNNSSADLSKFLKYQKKISEQNDGSVSERNSSLSESISSEQSSDQEELPVQQKSFKEAEASKFEVSKLKMSKIIPKLQLDKAKQIQSMIVKRLNNEQKKKSGSVVKQEKWKKIQKECEDLRRRLGEGLVLQHSLEKENSFLKKFIVQVESRNDLLVHIRQQKIIEKDYLRERKQFETDNLQTLLDVARDVLLNNRLKDVCKGNIKLDRKDARGKSQKKI